MLIGYCRVSTRDQDTELQRAALKKAGCKRVFEETASGATANRPALAAALDHLREGDALVVWRLDRLARSLKQLIDTVEHIEEQGANLVSLNEKLDTSTPSGRLVFHVFGALAEFERGLIRERTRAGLDAARAQGRRGGRPNKFTDKHRKRAEALLAAGTFSVPEVAREIGVSPATLYRHMPAAAQNASRK